MQEQGALLVAAICPSQPAAARIERRAKLTSRDSRVRVEIETRGADCIARVIIDNERKLNVLDSELMAELAAELDKLQSMEALRAVVLASAGSRAFIAGADIKEMSGLDATSARAFITGLHRCCDALRNLPVPVIARIQGFTFGAGMEIAAACDLRIASGTATFGMPEVKLGIPSVVEAALLPMLVGWGRTRQLLLLGETLSAAEAEDWGFIQRRVPANELDSALDEWLTMLLAAGPRAIRLQKALIRSWEDLPICAAVQAGADAFVEAWRTDEPQQAMKSFLGAQQARKRQR
jgi:enoyl-CoA hydratase